MQSEHEFELDLLSELADFLSESKRLKVISAYARLAVSRSAGLAERLK
jgi:hypothetical protein